MYKKNVVLFIGILFVIGGCKLFNKSSKIEDFPEFNKKFHHDTLFQLSRVDFPINGFFIDNNNEVSWTRDNWKIHKTPVGETQEGEYQVEVIKKDNLVIEKIWIENSEFYVERRFKKIDGKWYLVYFKDIN